MCICLNASAASDTHVYVGQATRNGRPVHVLAYQCQAEALDPSGKGAMLLPIPSNETLTEANFIDTSTFPGFLTDISNASKQQARSLMLSFSMRGMEDALVVERGATTYVYAANFAAAAAALGRVREDRRPTFSDAFIEGCSALYQDPIAIACWSGSVQTDPLLLWYVPSDPTLFRIPTMDAHDGNAPDVNADVDTDHILSVSASKATGNRVRYSDRIPADVLELLPEYVHGTSVRNRIPNGDVFVTVADTLEARPQKRRQTNATAAPSAVGVMAGWF